MKETRYTCDRCGAEIKDVLYSLTCYAMDVQSGGSIQTEETMEQNNKQNFNADLRHLCRDCKDKLTDGVFVR